MFRSSLPQTTPNPQPAARDAQRDAQARDVTPDPLRDARAARVAARVDACYRQAASLLFWADAATDDASSQAFLDERAALLAEADRLMGGAL